MKILNIKCIEFDNMSTWQIKYESEYRQEIQSWLTSQRLETKLSDRCLDEHNQLIWRIIFGRLIDTLLLTRNEDAILFKLSCDIVYDNNDDIYY